MNVSLVDKLVTDAEGKGLCVPCKLLQITPTSPFHSSPTLFQLDKGGFRINMCHKCM